MALGMGTWLGAGAAVLLAACTGQVEGELRLATDLDFVALTPDGDGAKFAGKLRAEACEGAAADGKSADAAAWVDLLDRAKDAEFKYLRHVNSTHDYDTNFLAKSNTGVYCVWLFADGYR